MAKIKRSYYLPEKLLKQFDRECAKGGYVREKVVAAAICAFLETGPDARQRMVYGLDAFLAKRAR